MANKGMLVLSRAPREEFEITIPDLDALKDAGFKGGKIHIAYLGQNHGEAEIGIHAPKCFKILRNELVVE